MAVLIEVCVDTAAGLAEAVAHGADRIELCTALDLGGLTPSAGAMRQAARSGAPVFAMIRPRAGDFVWSGAEVAGMEADIDAARAAGLAGVVLGASLPDGALDIAVLRRLVARADGLGLTLHRCFDLVPDADSALEAAVELEFDRILTSGGARTAPQGAAALGRLIARAAGRIVIMPGSGVSAATLPALAHLPLTEVHASCSVTEPQGGAVVDFGFGPALRRRTEGAKLRELRAALDVRG